MKKIILTIICAVAITLGASAQYLSVSTHDGLTLLVTPDEAGEMIVSGGLINIGEVTLNIADIEKMEYLTAPFDPQLVTLNYDNDICRVVVPIALMPNLNIERDGAYVTITSTTSADPEIIYSLSGKTANGSFTQVGEYKCGFILNGVDITSQRGAAMHIKNGKRIDIDVASHTVNRFADHADGLQDACFQVKGHPEFKGNGSIYITGNARHAYKSGEYTYFKRSTGDIHILAAQSDAMHIGQYFQMRGGSIDIASAVKGDGIQVEADTDPTKELNGQILLDSGQVNITLASDDVSGIKCDDSLKCNGGQYTINMSGKFAKGVNVTTSARLKALYGTPKFDITCSGGYLTVAGDKKKSTCFKIDGNMLFHAGNITTAATGDKARGLKIGGDYYYNPKTAVLSPNTPDVGGAMRILTD